MGNQLLKGKKGIVFGALDERSIAWITALKAVEEGAEIVLTNAPIALRMGKINELAAQCNNAPVIGADATSVEDLENLFTKAMEHFGGGGHKYASGGVSEESLLDTINRFKSLLSLFF